MMTIPFTKMVGTGNDFLIVDTRRGATKRLKRQWPVISRALCDRRNGVGADGLLVLEPSTRADVRMRVFNPDGSEAEMCGNGARCVAVYVRQHQPSGKLKARLSSRLGEAGVESGKNITIETKAGVLSAMVRGERVALCMTDPTELEMKCSLELNGRHMPGGFVNTGVPHMVIPVKALDQLDITQLGRAVRDHPAFAPHGTNANFIETDAQHPTHLRIRTYERGVEAETLACGTGVTAAAIVHALRHANGSSRGRQSHRIQVETRGNDRLTVSFVTRHTGATVHVSDVVLEGPARRICDGTILWPVKGAR